MCGFYVNSAMLIYVNPSFHFKIDSPKSPNTLNNEFFLDKKTVEPWASVPSYERLQLWLSTLLVLVHGYLLYL